MDGAGRCPSCVRTMRGESAVRPVQGCVAARLAGERAFNRKARSLGTGLAIKGPSASGPPTAHNKLRLRAQCPWVVHAGWTSEGEATWTPSTGATGTSSARSSWSARATCRSTWACPTSARRRSRCGRSAWRERRFLPHAPGRMQGRCALLRPWLGRQAAGKLRGTRLSPRWLLAALAPCLACNARC